MSEIMLIEPTVRYEPAKINFDLTEVDANINLIEKQLCTVSDDKKEIKQVCADLNKLSKAMNDKAIMIEKEATKEMKEFRNELKKRTDRIKALRDPLWEIVKPQPKPVLEKPKEIIEKIYWFKGDKKYIEQMISEAEFADIEVKEVTL